MSTGGGRTGARSLIVFVTLVVCLGPTASPARAGKADDLIKRGIELRRQRHDAQALELFKQAHEIDPGGHAAAQLGFAEQALGMWGDAETHLTEALRHEDDPWIKKNRAPILKAKDFVSSHLGSLEVWGEPTGAEVLIGGTSAGVLPLAGPLRVTAGVVSVTLRADGYLELVRSVDVGSGDVVRERFSLARKAARPINLAATPDDAGPSDGGKRSLVGIRARPAPQPPQSSPSVLSRWWFWTLVGAVVIGGGVAAYELTRPRNNCPAAPCTGVPN